MISFFFTLFTTRVVTHISIRQVYPISWCVTGPYLSRCACPGYPSVRYIPAAPLSNPHDDEDVVNAPSPWVLYNNNNRVYIYNSIPVCTSLYSFVCPWFLTPRDESSEDEEKKKETTTRRRETRPCAAHGQRPAGGKTLARTVQANWYVRLPSRGFLSLLNIHEWLVVRTSANWH